MVSETVLETGVGWRGESFSSNTTGMPAFAFPACTVCHFPCLHTLPVCSLLS